MQVSGLHRYRVVSPYDGSARYVRDHGVTRSCCTRADRCVRGSRQHAHPGWQCAAGVTITVLTGLVHWCDVSDADGSAARIV